MRIALIFALTLLTSCGSISKPSPVAPGVDLKEVLTGYWGSVSDGNFACSRSNANRIEFSQNGAKMFLHRPPGTMRDGKPRPYAEYDVLGYGTNVVRGRITDELRAAGNGDLVIWDLVLLSKDSFCWHRTDWGASVCTPKRRRCSALNRS